MRFLGLCVSLFLVGCSSARTSGNGPLPVAFYDRVVSDIERIQPATTEKFSNLEIDYVKTVAGYRTQFMDARSVEEQIAILQKAYYAYHDNHFIQFAVEGVTAPTAENLNLPFRVMPSGNRLSEAHFTVFHVDDSSDWFGDKPQIGDELIAIDGQSIQKILLENRDRFKDSNPVGVLFNFAVYLTRQQYNPKFVWEEYPEKKSGLTQKFKFLRAGKEVELTEVWQKHARDKIPLARDYGKYQPHYLAGKVGDESYGLELTDQKKKYLVIKLTGFVPANQKIIDLLSEQLKDAQYRKSLKGIVLDFSQNGGGDDQAFPFLYLVTGRDFYLNWHSTPNVKELDDPEIFPKVAIHDDTFDFLASKRSETPLNHFLPAVPFDCSRKGCGKGSGKFLESLYGKDSPQKLSIIPTVLVSSPYCGSKCDETAKIFSAQKLGPIVGLPNSGADGRFNELYKVYTETYSDGKEIKVTVRFVPTASVDMNCKLTMGLGEPVDQAIDFKTMLYDPGQTDQIAISSLSEFSPGKVHFCKRTDADQVFKSLNPKPSP